MSVGPPWKAVCMRERGAQAVEMALAAVYDTCVMPHVVLVQRSALIDRW